MLSVWPVLSQAAVVGGDAGGERSGHELPGTTRRKVVRQSIKLRLLTRRLYVQSLGCTNRCTGSRRWSTDVLWTSPLRH